MSHYYGQIDQSARKTIPTARGHKSTGIQATVACWDGAIRTRLYWNERKSCNYYVVERINWPDDGGVAILDEGPIEEHIS